MELYKEQPGKYSTTATTTVTETQRILSNLGHGYKRAKAQQIVRLLTDQACLNQRFKDCALDCDEDYENVNRIPGGNGDDLGHAQNVPDHASKKSSAGTKKLASSVDPGRCRTSMGFYNQAEFSTPPEGDGDVDDDDEALSVDDARDDDLDVSFDTRDVLMNKLSATAGRHANPQRSMLRLELQGEDHLVMEEGVTPSAGGRSRPKTGIVGGAAKGKQYRRPAHNNPNMKTMSNAASTTTVTIFEPQPFTPRGGVRGFCDGQGTPREDAIPCITPRQSDFKICLSPRKNEVDFCYTPRGNPISNNPSTPRHAHQHTTNHSDLSGFYSARYQDAVTTTTSTAFTPRHNEAGGGFYTSASRLIKNDGFGTPRREDVGNPSMPPRSHFLHKAVRDGFSTPRADPTTPCTTPRGDGQMNGLTPRLQHHRVGGAKQHQGLGHRVVGGGGLGRKSENHLFNVSPSTATFSCEPSPRPKRTNLVTKSIALAEQAMMSPRAGPHTPRSVLTVDQSPIHVIPTGGAQDGEVMTPRRSKASHKGQKPRGNGDLQRMGVHQNLNKLSEMVQPITVMKLPPLDAAMNNPMISQGI